MATATLPAAKHQIGERRFVLDGVDWEGYETLLRLFPRTRMTYDRGVVELMSPMYVHELYRKRLASLIETLADELEIPYIAAGSTTFRRQLLDRGLEPDESYYLTSIGRLNNRMDINLDVDPPPDLAVEVDITSSSLDRMGIYAALGVPEVWRFDGEIFTVQLLRADRFYALSQSSRAFGFLPIGDIPGRLLDARFPDEMRWGKACRAWVRDVVAPHFRDDPR
jgi:Uma2 family endonuclease